jgi:hypothetical protein
MSIQNSKTLYIQKNRGWRGLAQAILKDSDGKITSNMVFSFSQDVWNDLMVNYMVFQDKDNYYVINFNEIKLLPHGKQRSVLIKNFEGEITSIKEVAKDKWTAEEPSIYRTIKHFLMNKNNHTTSDWNQIGLRVDLYSI